MDSLIDSLITFFNSDAWMGADGVITLLTLIAAGGNLFYSMRQNSKKKKLIRIRFQHSETGERFDVEELIREHFRRSEVQGILRNKLKEGIAQFDIAYLSDKKYLRDVFAVQQGKKDELVIRIGSDELKLFKELPKVDL